MLGCFLIRDLLRSRSNAIIYALVPGPNSRDKFFFLFLFFSSLFLFSPFLFFPISLKILLWKILKNCCSGYIMRCVIIMFLMMKKLFQCASVRSLAISLSPALVRFR